MEYFYETDERLPVKLQDQTLGSADRPIAQVQRCSRFVL